MSTTTDINGKESSKRLWAKRFFTLGLVVFIIFFIFWALSLFFKEILFSIPAELLEMWTWMMGFGSLVLVGTVLERPKSNQ